MQFGFLSAVALAVATDVDEEALNLLQTKVNLHVDAETNATWELCCPRGYEQMGNIGDDVQGWGLVWPGNKASNIKNCQAQCDRDPACGSFEYNKEKGECALNDWADSNTGAQNEKWGWAITCKRPFTMSCPAGYTQMGDIGDDVRGWGLLLLPQRGLSLEACQAKCDGDRRCGSFEYNKGECTLNDWADSNSGAQNAKWGWALTCKRPFTMSCPAGYTQMGEIGDDVRGGGLSLLPQRVSSLEACKIKCDGDARCGSFEYNKGECALNDWADSNTGAQNAKWGWTITCQRPFISMSCPAGYSQMGNIGDVVLGWGLVWPLNRASSLRDCQAQCDRDTRCGSFEYNKEQGQCALNDWANSNTDAQNAKWGLAISCQRPFISMSCPDGYSQMGNIGDDVRGWGLVWPGNRASSLGDCQAQCDRNNRCGSFEYNKEKGECALNDWASSNTGAQNGKRGWTLTCARTGQRCPVSKKIQ